MYWGWDGGCSEEWVPCRTRGSTTVKNGGYPAVGECRGLWFFISLNSWSDCDYLPVHAPCATESMRACTAIPFFTSCLYIAPLCSLILNTHSPTCSAAGAFLLFNLPIHSHTSSALISTVCSAAWSTSLGLTMTITLCVPHTLPVWSHCTN